VLSLRSSCLGLRDLREQRLDARLRRRELLDEARDTGKVVGNERIAIMAALNIAHESLSNKGSGAALDAAAFRRRIVAMQETIDSALAADQEKLF